MATETKTTTANDSTDLMDRNEKLSGAVARHRRDAEEAEEKLKAAEKTIKQLTTERDEFKAKSDTSAMSKRVKELEGIIRNGKHQETFGRLAKERGLDPDAVGYLYQLSGWKAEADEIDEEAMGTVLDEMKGKPGLSRLFVPPETQSGQQPVKKPAKASGQGTTDGTRTGSKFTEAQLSDPVFSMRNWQAIVDDAAGQVERGEI